MKHHVNKVHKCYIDASNHMQLDYIACSTTFSVFWWGLSIATWNCPWACVLCYTLLVGNEPLSGKRSEVIEFQCPHSATGSVKLCTCSIQFISFSYVLMLYRFKKKVTWRKLNTTVYTCKCLQWCIILHLSACSKLPWCHKRKWIAF